MNQRTIFDPIDKGGKREGDEEKNHLRRSFFISFWFVGLLWLIKFLEIRFHFDIVQFSLLPRTLSGLPGILTSPFIHGDFQHLFSNSFPLIILGTALFHIYRKIAWHVVILIVLLGGIGTWIFARPVYHIGASGLVYGMVCFIFFSGIIRLDKRSIALSLVVTFLYGGMIWGVLPILKGISWESHLSGSIVGAVLAFIFRKKQSLQKEEDEWEDEYWDNDNGWANRDQGRDYH